MISPSLQLKVNGHIYRKNVLANKVVCKFMELNEEFIKPKMTSRMLLKRVSTQLKNMVLAYHKSPDKKI
jgi:hypothetical protein